MDLDALREAVESRERLDQMSRYRGYSPPFDPILAAARAVLDSEEAWWCWTHKAESVNQDVPSEDQTSCWLWMDLDDVDKPDGPCSMVRVRLLAEEGT